MIKEGRGQPVCARVGGDQRKEARWPWCRSPDKASLNEENRRKGYVKEMEFLCGYFFYIFAMKGQFFNKRNRYFMNIG